MASRTLSPRALLLLGLVLLLLAALVLVVDLASWRAQTRASASFSQVEGTVLAAELLEDHKFRGSDTYSPRVRYRYTVAGRSFDNDVYAFSNITFEERQPVQQFLDRHPVGGPILVHYDPADPVRSVLSAAPPSAAGFWFPILPAGFGVLLLAMAFRRSRPVESGGRRRWAPA